MKVRREKKVKMSEKVETGSEEAREVRNEGNSDKNTHSNNNNWMCEWALGPDGLVWVTAASSFVLCFSIAWTLITDRRGKEKKKVSDPLWFSFAFNWYAYYVLPSTFLVFSTPRGRRRQDNALVIRNQQAHSSPRVLLQQHTTGWSLMVLVMTAISEDRDLHKTTIDPWPDAASFVIYSSYPAPWSSNIETHKQTKQSKTNIRVVQRPHPDSPWLVLSSSIVGPSNHAITHILFLLFLHLLPKKSKAQYDLVAQRKTNDRLYQH